MADDEDGLSDELELVRAMYTAEEDELSIEATSDGLTVLQLRLQPQTGGARAQRFMETVLQLRLGAEYPTAPPAVRLHHARGLLDTEEAKLLGSVRSRAAEMAGEHCVYALVEHTLEVLTELNAGGDCPMCCEPLFDASAGGAFLSRCFHSYHKSCLSQWWASYEPPASKTPAADIGTGGVEQRVEAAAQASRAAAAECAQLEKRVASSVDARELHEQQLAAMMAMVEPAAPEVMVRRKKEQLETASKEEQSLQARLEARRGRLRACQADEEAARAECSAAAVATPLPCPVCRTALPVAELEAGGVCKASATSAVTATVATADALDDEERALVAAAIAANTQAMQRASAAQAAAKAEAEAEGRGAGSGEGEAASGGQRGGGGGGGRAAAGGGASAGPPPAPPGLGLPPGLKCKAAPPATGPPALCGSGAEQAEAARDGAEAAGGGRGGRGGRAGGGKDGDGGGGGGKARGQWGRGGRKGKGRGKGAAESRPESQV